MLQTQYPDVDVLIKELSDKIKVVFGDELKGVYLFGSLVMGDFEPKRSDVDLVAIVAHDVTAQQLDKLGAVHSDFVRDHPEWSDRVEVAYVPAEGMQNFKSKSCQIARISPGEPLHFRSMDKDWLMDWYMVLRYGQTVWGPSPDELIPKISQQEFIDSLKNYLPQWLSSAKQAHHVGYQSYIILSLCRSLYVFAHGEQVSKRRAAEWAMRQ